MRDWGQMLLERLACEKRGAEIEPEVAEELAHHLQDVCEAGLQAGLSQEESARRAWAEVKNWSRLARRINEARGGNEMLKQRIQRLWLPGIATMIAAFGILFAGPWVGMQPRMIEISPRISVFLNLPWLLILPAMGALAAYWSRRAGGSVAIRAAAALFPATTMLVIYLVVLIRPACLGFSAGHGIDVAAVFADDGPRASSILMVLVSPVEGILLPAAALLVGALPFLGKGSTHRRAPADKLSAGAA